MMIHQEIANDLNLLFGESTVLETQQESGLMPILVIETSKLKPVCQFLFENEKYFFDFLTCITAIDNGLESNSMEIAYNLYSIPYEKSICLKIKLDRQNPKAESISSIWKAANWHEREAYDMFGIQFDNHPDLRRILLPADWEGFPLRKDYDIQEYYHNIKVAY